MNILLTGGTGYIGSHSAVELSQAGHEVVLLDNFCNSNPVVLERLRKILGKSLPFIQADVRATDVIEKVLREYKIDAVIHFAGLKAVGESVEKPIEYYSNNVQGTISLLKAMKSINIKNLVFSSSATVYGDPEYLPIDEDHHTSATNAYGRSKLHIEEMLKDTGGDVFVLDMSEPVRIYDLAVKMIYLSGLLVKDEAHPHGDIEIAVTGLRPGEKLYEELLIGENPQPTSHPKIMKAHEEFLSWDELQQELEKLNLALEACDGRLIKARLKKLVPGYESDRDVMDWNCGVIS